MELISWYEQLNVLERYLQFRSFVMMFLYMFIALLILLIFLKKITINKESSIIKLFIEIILFMVAGYTFRNLPLDFNITLKFYADILLIAMITFLIYCIRGFYKYEKSRHKFYNDVKRYVKYISFLTLFVLSINSALFLLELITLCIVVYFAENIKFSKITDSHSFSEYNDSPVESKTQLFDVRKKELVILKDYLDKNSCNFKSIAINAPWGQGKTSFVNVLTEDLKETQNTKIAYIDPNIETDLDKMLNQLVIQIEKHLEDEKIYSGRGSSLNNYFVFLSSIILSDKNSLLSDWLKKIFITEKATFKQLRSEVENDLLGGKNNPIKLIIVVDDLDRCSKETILEVFKFLNAVFSFKGCTLLFSVDIDQIEEMGIKRSFLDKYITDYFDLTQLTNKDICDYFINGDEGTFLNKNFFEQDVNSLELKTQMKNFVDGKKYYSSYFEDGMKNFIEKKKEELKNSEKENRDMEELIIQEGRDKLRLIKEQTKNPRKVKKFLRDFERTIKVINVLWFNDEMRRNSEYSSYDWVEIAFRLCFIKIHFEKDYEKLTSCGIEEYRSGDSKNPFILYFLSEAESNQNGEIIINKLMYEIFNVPSTLDLSLFQNVQDQIEQGLVEEKHILYAFENFILKNNIGEQNLELIFESIKKIESPVKKKMVLIDLFVNLERIIRYNNLIDLNIFKGLFEYALKFEGEYDSGDIQTLVESVEKKFKHYISHCISAIYKLRLLLYDDNVSSVKTPEVIKDYDNLNEFIKLNFKKEFEKNQDDEMTSINNIEKIINKIKIKYTDYEDHKESIECLEKKLIENLTIINYLIDFNNEILSLDKKNKDLPMIDYFNYEDMVSKLPSDLKNFEEKLSVIDCIEEILAVAKKFSKICVHVNRLLNTDNVALKSKVDFKSMDRVHKEIKNKMNLNSNYRYQEKLQWAEIDLIFLKIKYKMRQKSTDD